MRSLSPADADELSVMLTTQRRAYMQYFTPFDFDVSTIGQLLATYNMDVYLGLYWGEELAAFCMLRGWDEGYIVPSYGVVVAEKFRDRGIGTMTVELAKVICRMRGSPRLMLKVHTDNAIAKSIYEAAGFLPTGRDAQNNNVVMHYDFS
jgi:ribosomal protein S18 acetylase RimI-like enzyme